MHSLRFGSLFALAAAISLGGCTAQPGDARLARGAAQADLLTREFDRELGYQLGEMIASAAIGPNGEVFLQQPVGDRRFLKAGSGRYWQISGKGYEDFRSRSLGNRALKAKGGTDGIDPLYYDSDQFPDEPLRIAERTLRLPGSDVEWRFVVARAREG